jgi:membrane peptidoglycan carboxypeptidase
MDPKTGEILAMVGSRDYFDEEISGQVNVATSPRQPGSTIKPITYAAAFSKGWGPQTIILDDQTEFPPTSPGPPWRPQNFDRSFDGPMTIRHALATSKNIPAVKTLMYVGVQEFLELAGRVGLRMENPEQYGLTLALGAAPVSLLDMVGAYTVLDNYGLYNPPMAILKVEDWDGNVLEEFAPAAGQMVLGEEQAYMITSILSDNWARTPLYGPDSPLRLGRPAAAKTGSTDDYRDSWIVGYTPSLVAGVWVGNTDNTPMVEVSGSHGAGRIWNSFMEAAHEGTPPQDFLAPPGVQEYQLCLSTGGPVTPECDVVLTEAWPRSYEPARFADIPGLPSFGEQQLASMGGRVLGLTVSREGRSLRGGSAPVQAAPELPEATATPGAEQPEPAPAPGPTAEPQHPDPTPVPAAPPAEPEPAATAPPGQGAPPPGQGSTPPGQGGTPPGQSPAPSEAPAPEPSPAGEAPSSETAPSGSDSAPGEPAPTG